MPIFTGNKARELSHFFSRFQPYTYQRYDIRDSLKHLNPQFEIISYEYFIVHTPWNDHLELPTHTTIENSDLVHTPARMQLYYLPDLRFTLDLKYCSYEYSFSRSLE